MGGVEGFILLAILHILDNCIFVYFPLSLVGIIMVYKNKENEMESILNLAQNIWTSYPVAGVIILLLVSFPIIRLMLRTNDEPSSRQTNEGRGSSFNVANGRQMMGGSNYDVSGAPKGYRNAFED